MLEHPYAAFLSSLTKPAQYLGGEQGQRIKEGPGVDARICLAFPDLYEIGMSHLGYKILYALLNESPRISAERAYAPWDDLERELRARGEHLRSLETWRPLSAFDAVGFSLQYELTYTNVLAMLELGGIPLRSAERGPSDPLVLAGGPVATHAEPIAPFIDLFLVGDGEKRASEILLAWVDARRAGLSRPERLRSLARLEGCYVPSLYSTSIEPRTGLHYVLPPQADLAPFPIRRTFVPDLDAFPFPTHTPVASIDTVFDRTSVEVARGCTEGCRFCQAGMIYRPVRERSAASIRDTVLREVRERGFDEASLTSLSTADYSAIGPLVRTLTGDFQGANVALSVSSLRAYGLPEHVLDDLRAARAGGLTFAPEAGTQRLRDVINKNITEEQLLETTRRIFARGWSRMKLYFMIGLPTETDEDVLGIIETGRRVLEIGRSTLPHGRPTVVISVSTFVPKPHTPFAWCAMDDETDVSRKQALLRHAVRGTGLDLRLHRSMASWLEATFARGDRNLAEVLETGYRMGARFDAWEEKLRPDLWREAFKQRGLAPSTRLGTLPTDASLPWSHIDVGIDRGFLEREYRRALSNRLSPPCGKPAGDDAETETAGGPLVCYHCGIACDLAAMKSLRDVHLESVGAIEPMHRDSSSALEAAARHPGRHDKGHVAPQFVRIRIAYTKTGRLSYCSHLDLVRILPRILRQTGLPLFYTAGFHPKPDLTFAPALGLGVASLAEILDVKVDPSASLDTLLERLRGTGVDGLGFKAIHVLGPADAGLGKVIDQASYLAALPRSWLMSWDPAGNTAWAKSLARRAQAGLRTERVRDEVSRPIDVSASLADLAFDASCGPRVLQEASLAGDLWTIGWTLHLNRGLTPRPEEVIAALFGHKDVPARFVRTALSGAPHGTRATPLELERLRAPAPSVSAPREVIAP